MGEKTDKGSKTTFLVIIGFFLMAIGYAAYVTQYYHRDSIAFTGDDRFEVTNQNDLNISIPKGYSIRTEYIESVFSSRIYGWYLTKSSCTDIVKMPDPDKESEYDQKAMANFYRNIYNENGIKVDISGLGICAESTQDGIVRFYADKRAKESLSLPETVEAIQGALLVKAQIEGYQKERINTEKKRKESWGAKGLSH